jgi:hypothetical protein
MRRPSWGPGQKWHTGEKISASYIFTQSKPDWGLFFMFLTLNLVLETSGLLNIYHIMLIDIFLSASAVNALS